MFGNSGFFSSSGEPYIEDDIAYDSKAERNADPCTTTGCLWPKSSDGKVYIAYDISSKYTPREVAVIERALHSFNDVSCLRFVKRTDETAYLKIQSLSGCYSYIGYRNRAVDLSLNQASCIYHQTVQHEVLHSLGFHHEQSRSDRDNHIRIFLENVTPGHQHNFNTFNTLNQGLPYDYGSVMHYYRFAFSKNGKPTMEAIPNSLQEFGRATQMSKMDILRLNKLYKC